MRKLMQGEHYWKANFRDRVMKSPRDTLSAFTKNMEKRPCELDSFEVIFYDKVVTVNFARRWNPLVYSDEKGRWGSVKHKVLLKEKRPLNNTRVIYEPLPDGGVRLGYTGTDDNGAIRKRTVVVV